MIGGADRLPGEQLQGTVDRAVAEGAALHHDMVAQRVEVGYLEYLEEAVLDDGVGEAAEMSPRVAFWRSSCFTFEFMKTVQREPRSPG